MMDDQDRNSGDSPRHPDHYAEPETSSGSTAPGRKDGGGSADGQDRSLLIGLLAMQDGFIDHSTLVDSIHAWMADKELPLGTILVRWKAIDEVQNNLLEQLADQHIRRHGGDLARSVAAVSATVSRDELDPDVTRLTNRLRVNRARFEPEGKGSRFRVIKFHAQGGLGDIYLGEDEQLGRNVAIKEVQPKSDIHNEQDWVRLRLEAEVTGGLEHPGIVPVYGLGVYQDGRPYYAMRFIKGRNLKEEIDHFRSDKSLDDEPGRRISAFRRLLGRFVDVCFAIEYAHNRGVLHLDLKPSNIMVGRYRETLVVDWGLAMLLGKAEGNDPASIVDEEVLQASASSMLAPSSTRKGEGTAPYMSPEQAEGRVNDFRSTTDVYALGATLYHLLTGQAPFLETELDQIQPRLSLGKFPKPRTVDRTVPPALESICLKAMAVRPEDRYRSALALADDIEHYLDDEPVKAHAESLASRAWRWGRKHRSMVVGMVATLVVASIALGVSNFLIGQAYDRARLAEAQSKNSLERIEQTLGVTGETIETLMGSFAGDQLATSLELQRIRGYLADNAAKVSKTLLDQRPDDPYIKVTVTPILHQTAVIHRVLHRFDESFKESEQALSLYKGIPSQDKNHRILNEDAQARLLYEYAVGLDMVGRTREALARLGSAREILETLHLEYPRDRTYEQTLARIENAVGWILIDQGDYQEAGRRFEVSARILIRKVERPDPFILNRYLMVWPLLGRAVAAYKRGDGQAAEPLFKQAMATVDRLEELGWRNSDSAYLRAKILVHRGTWLGSKMFRWSEAEGEINKGLAILEDLDRKISPFSTFRTQVVEALVARAVNRSSKEPADRAGALADAKAALELIQQDEQSIHQFPSGMHHAPLKGRALGILGRLEEDPGKAREYLDRALIEHGKSIAMNPNNPDLRAAMMVDQAALDRLKK